MSVPADRNLLFGLVALQTGMIGQSALVAAFHLWTRDKNRPIAEILLGQGAIDSDDRTLLDGLVAKHLKRHGDDVEKSLAAIPARRSLVTGLVAIGDEKVKALVGDVSLGAHATAQDDDGFDADSTTSMGRATGDGQRFRVLRPHARGGLGAVFVALDAELNREVALKQILEHHADDTASRTRFVLEAEITGGLEHPGIVPVYGLGSDGGGRPYYAMRFIRGESLKDTIAAFHADPKMKGDPGRRSLALRTLLRRFVDVCNAIEYAHTRGVIHRDIKPANIIVGKYGETLVVDWGLAKPIGRAEPTLPSDERTLMPSSASVSTETLPGSAMGTPAYMSPEQATGDLERLGPRCDVYSLGATLYCLLTGAPPFGGDDVGAVLQAVAKGDFPRPRSVDPSIDPALESVCRKAMATKREDRYPSCRALADDVERWAADEPVSAWREPVGRRLRRWGRRHRLLVTSVPAMLVVAVAALAVGDVLIAHQRDRAERSLAFARQVVDEMYTGVAENLDDQPQMDDYQRQLLEKALKFYERFALPQSRDPQLTLEAARAGMRAGGIRSRLGQTVAAEQADRHALEVLGRLVADNPAESTYRDALADAHRELGDVLRAEELRPESEREIKTAVALWDALARAQPKIAEFRSKLADAHGRLGDQFQIEGRVEEAKAAFRQALEIAEELAREQPEVSAIQESLATILRASARLKSNKLHDDPGATALMERSVAISEKLAGDHPEIAKYQLSLASGLQTLGERLAFEAKFPQAEAIAQRSIAIMEKLATLHPQNMNIAVGLATSYDMMKRVRSFSGDSQSALEWSGRSISALRSLARRDPRNLRISRRHLWGHLGERGETLSRLGRLTEALADFKEALELAHDNRNKEEEIFRTFSALTKARLGDLSEIALVRDEVRKVVEVGAGRGGETVYNYWILYYDAACVHMALAQLALVDPDIPPVERDRLGQQERRRALELLEKSHATGEFMGMVRIDEARRERLLDPLRTHPRFQLLMMDLAFPDNPFPPLRDQD